MRLVDHIENPGLKLLFLGYSETETSLVGELISRGCEVWHSTEKIKSTEGFDLVISYGYRHILTQAQIESSNAPIVNLHISYLPWNRGAHPNFWSFFDATPSGVTIHLIDPGIDTGPVMYQCLVNFDAGEITFAQTYQRLIAEIEALFVKNIDDIMNQTYPSVRQRRKGTFHLKSQLPKEFAGWDSEIASEIARLDVLYPSDHSR